MPRNNPTRRRRCSRAPAAIAVCVAVFIAAVMLAAGPASRAPVASGPSGGAPSAEVVESNAAIAADVVATTNPARLRPVPMSSRTFVVGLAAVLLGAVGSGIAGRSSRPRRMQVLLDDVGDRWRALLIGAPPVLLSR